MQENNVEAINAAAGYCGTVLARSAKTVYRDGKYSTSRTRGVSPSAAKLVPR
jgi:hypothetical protein